MIKRLNTLQLSSAKPRTGLQSIAELLPRLIQQYEMQAKLARNQVQANAIPVTLAHGHDNGTEKQVTFSWYNDVKQ